VSSSFGIPAVVEAEFLRERASATPSSAKKLRTTERDPEQRVGEPLPFPLTALQQWFASVMTSSDSAAAAVAAQAAVAPEDVERVVRPGLRLSAVDRIEIYHAAYRARLVECLLDDYPSLKYALGEEHFEHLCHRYIAAHPSNGPNLNSFGRHMASFCRAYDHPLAPFLADLASLEWAMVEVLHAEQAPPISLAALASIAPDRWGGVRLSRSETVRLLELSYPVNVYLQDLRGGGAPDLPEPAWSSVAVYRDGALIWRMNLDRPMATLLGGLLGGSTLAESLERMAALPEFTQDMAPRVMGWFRDFIGHGLFCAVSPPD
jgi:Putative DNA-binding domain